MGKPQDIGIPKAPKSTVAKFPKLKGNPSHREVYKSVGFGSKGASLKEQLTQLDATPEGRRSDSNRGE
jgi:hypothetical protein